MTATLTTPRLIVTIPCCPPAGVSANSRLHWRRKSELIAAYRCAAFEATCQALEIPYLDGWQGPYTPPEWLRPAYAAMDRRESNRLPVGQRQRGSWRPLPELLTLDVLIVWKAGQGRQDSTNLPHAAKHAIDGMCNAIALNDRLIRLGTVRQERADKRDSNDWTQGRTELVLRPLEDTTP